VNRFDTAADNIGVRATQFARSRNSADWWTAPKRLTLIPKAIATRDSNLLHRVLIELRSFDNLLAFRFG
jgi:hypothetical protein